MFRLRDYLATRHTTSQGVGSEDKFTKIVVDQSISSGVMVGPACFRSFGFARPSRSSSVENDPSLPKRPQKEVASGS